MARPEAAARPAQDAPLGADLLGARVAQAPSRPWLATYRLQLQAGFTFDDAAAVADYLAALGASHVYCSPYLQAAPGSTSGYDVVDHSRLNDQLGGPPAHRRVNDPPARARPGPPP